MSKVLPSTNSNRTISSTGGFESTFTAKDGVSLRYAHWPASRKPPVGTVVYLNGRTEFLEKNIETALELTAKGFDVFTLDWRGQGLSHRLLKNRHKGHILRYEQYLEDLDVFISEIVKPESSERLILMAHSMGAHIALRFLHDNQKLFKRAVLTAPMVGIHIGGKWKTKIGKAIINIGHLLKMDENYMPGFGNYGKRDRQFAGNKRTSDIDRFNEEHDIIESNPDLAVGGPTIGWLYATFESIKILTEGKYAKEIKTPMLIVSASSDQIVCNQAQNLFTNKVPNSTFHVVDGAQHEILREKNVYRNQFWEYFDK